MRPSRLRKLRNRSHARSRRGGCWPRPRGGQRLSKPSRRQPGMGDMPPERRDVRADFLFPGWSPAKLQGADPLGTAPLERRQGGAVPRALAPYGGSPTCRGSNSRPPLARQRLSGSRQHRQRTTSEAISARSDLASSTRCRNSGVHSSMLCRMPAGVTSAAGGSGLGAGSAGSQSRSFDSPDVRACSGAPGRTSGIRGRKRWRSFAATSVTRSLPLWWRKENDTVIILGSMPDVLAWRLDPDHAAA